MAILERGKEEDDPRLSLAAIAKAMNGLELIGEVTKQLDRAPTVNLSFNPQFIELRTVIVRALRPHPEARGAVLQAIREHENGE